jgi:hypothetical protein
MSQYYLFKNGASEGPYTVARLHEMVQEGTVEAETLASRPGDTDWVPAFEILPELTRSQTGTELPSMYTPPQSRDAAQMTQPFVINGRVVAGTEGLSMEQILEMTAAGGRFVTFTFAFSLLIMSFRRSSRIYFLRPGENGAMRALGFNLLSGTVGWWGFPWGIIFTIQSIFRNACGGVDVTEPILASILGARGADQLVRSRPPAAKGLLILTALAGLIIPVMLIYTLSQADGDKGSSRPSRSSPYRR